MNGLDITLDALRYKKPSIPLIELRNSGRLKQILPEVDVLFGIPQNKLHHPEIDTGIHSMMVVDQSALLSSDVNIRFAALVHDVGKALTSRDKLPEHSGHEERGGGIIQKIYKRMALPGNMYKLAFFSAINHGCIHEFNSMCEKRKSKLKTLIKQSEKQYGAQFIFDFLVVCEADYKGRPGYENKPLPNKDEILKWIKNGSN